MARRELLSLSVWNERMHERLLQTVESGVRVLPWGSLFRAIDFHPPPTISPPNTTNGPRAKEKGRKDDGDGTRKRLTGGRSLAFSVFPPFFHVHVYPYPTRLCILLYDLFRPFFYVSMPTTSIHASTDLHLCRVPHLERVRAFPYQLPIFLFVSTVLPPDRVERIFDRTTFL